MGSFLGITKLKSKIHRATVTDANTKYEGSITIDEELLRLAGVEEYEKVDIYNVDNGARFSTYVIKGKNGDICLNGAATKKVTIGDKIIICSYMVVDVSGFRTSIEYVPVVINVDDENKVKEK